MEQNRTIPDQNQTTLTSSKLVQPKLVPLESISAGLAATARKSERDDNDKREEDDLTLRRTRAEIGIIEQANWDRGSNRRLRFQYARSVYRYLCCYSAGCGSVLLLSGFKVYNFSLPNEVLITLVGSTALAAIGLVGFVVSGLFKPNG